MSAPQRPGWKTQGASSQALGSSYRGQTGSPGSKNLHPKPRSSCSSGGVQAELRLMCGPELSPACCSAQADRQCLFFHQRSQKSWWAGGRWAWGGARTGTGHRPTLLLGCPQRMSPWVHLCQLPEKPHVEKAGGGPEEQDSFLPGGPPSPGKTTGSKSSTARASYMSCSFLQCPAR